VAELNPNDRPCWLSWWAGTLRASASVSPRNVIAKASPAGTVSAVLVVLLPS
jgi:hypothetical protein